MINQQLLDDLKNCSAGNIKKIVINDKYEFLNFEIKNNPNTDNISLILFVKKEMGIDRITNLKVYNNKNDIIIERNTDTIVNTDFYYRFTLRFLTKEARLIINAL